MEQLFQISQEDLKSAPYPGPKNRLPMNSKLPEEQESGSEHLDRSDSSVKPTPSAPTESSDTPPGYRVRTDENTGLKALFEKAFFDVPYSPESITSLEKTRFVPKSSSKVSTENFGDQPRTVLLYSGPSGVGKSRVFRQFRNYAEERKIPVYEIHCYDVESIPFKPFLRVIREILTDFQFEDILREKYRVGLESFLPELFQDEEEEAKGVSLDSTHWEKLDQWKTPESWEEDKIRIFEGIAQLLFDITQICPVIILIHDLNWGDQATIELLRYIGRNLQLRNHRKPDWSGGEGSSYSDAHWVSEEGEIDDPDHLDLTSGTARDALGSFLDSDVDERASSLGSSEYTDSYGLSRDGEASRLMILANYESSRDGNSYIDAALDRLGEEPFGYHGKISTLELEDTELFFKQFEGGVPLDGPDVLEKMHQGSQGFPGFLREAVRLVFEKREQSNSNLEAPITSQEVDAILEGEASTPADSKEQDDSSESKPTDRAHQIRHSILKNRLALSPREDIEILQVLSLARKPLSLTILAHVLDQPESEIQSRLDRLQGRHLIEPLGQLFPHGIKEDGYYFQIWDYSEVISEGIDSLDSRQSIHQKIAKAFKETLSPQLLTEKAFEVFYHCLRGGQCEESIHHAFTAVDRLANSFSLERANIVLQDLQDGLLATKSDSGELQEEQLRILHRAREQQTAFWVALQDYESAEKSIQELIKSSAPEIDDSQRSLLLLRESEIHRRAGDTNKALKSQSKSYKLISDSNSQLAVSWHLFSAQVRHDRADVKRGINLALKGIKIAKKRLEEDTSGKDFIRKKDQRDLAELYRLLAQLFWNKGDDAHAVDNFQRSLNQFEGLGDESESAKVLDDLGKVYLERGNYFRAARYFYKALESKRRGRDIAGLCESYDRLGLVYLRTGDEIKTIGLLNHSIHLKEKIGDLQGLNPTLGILGELYFRLGRYEKATAYFKREIQNSQTLHDTAGLVEAFTHLGWVCFEIGDFKQVEDLHRQIGILSSEFKLKEQEAGGARLGGVYQVLQRNWTEAEALFKTALETFSKQGNKRQEAEVLLDQAEVRYTRESYPDALKVASKGLVAAEQLKAIDLQVRALIIKGNIYRFLKGGQPEKAKEVLRKGLELAQTVNDVHLLFQIYYSLAKVYHYDHEFVEAGSFYGKAEAILRRIADDLPDDQTVRYFEHPQRKVFLEDANRYRKEVKGRSEAESIGDPRERLSTLSSADLRDQPVGLPNFKDLNERLLRLNASQHSSEFFVSLLREVVDLVHSERAFILRVQSRKYFLVAQEGFGEKPQENEEFPMAQAITEEVIRKGSTVLLSGPEEIEREGRYPRGGALAQRSLLVIPLVSNERNFGAIYLDRSLSLGKFTPRDQLLCEALASHMGVALDNRRHYEATIVEPLTGLYSSSYFIERLKEVFRQNNLHGRPFFLLGFYMPTLESSMKEGARLLGERLNEDLNEELPPEAIACWGSPILSVLVTDKEYSQADRLAQKIRTKLVSLVNCGVETEILAPDARIPNGAQLFYEMRRQLLPDESDQHTLLEIRELLSQDISLKDAKRILEKHIIENTLKKTGGNITHAAKELGIHRPQLSNLLKKHALKRERFERNLEMELDQRNN